MKNNGNHQNDGKINQQQQRTKIMIHSDDDGGAGGGGAKAATPIGQVGVKIPDGKQQQLGNSGREEEKRQDKWIEVCKFFIIFFSSFLVKFKKKFFDLFSFVVRG